MSDFLSGFKIPQENRQQWWSIASIWIGSMICIPALMVGGYLAQGFSFGGIILSCIIGFGIICAYMCFQGMQACDTGLPTVSMAAASLGIVGSRLISLLLGVVCIGWFGIQASVCGISFSVMFASITGITIPVWVCTIISGVLMFLTAMYGYKAIKYLNYIAVPLLILVIGYVIIAALFLRNGIPVIAAYSPTSPMPFIAGINMAVATFAVGGVISGDYSRFAKNRGDVIKSSAVGLLPIGIGMLLVGAVSSIVAGEYDITKVLANLGLPAIGLIALILAAWTTNTTNAYSGGLAISSFLGFTEEKFKLTTGIAGAIGTLLAAVGILERFTTFLGIITAFIPPIAGIIIASYWVIGKGKAGNFKPAAGINWAGIISFAAGSAVAYITANVIPFFVAPINGIVISIIAYVLLIKVIPAKAVD
ncbi:MAG: cytosine permease [Treponema sp.]|jgi:cytosine permease|nr:cytosine permease [Treponema sp.]